MEKMFEEPGIYRYVNKTFFHSAQAHSPTQPPRFGVAVSSVRTKFQKKIQRRAREFLRNARKSDSQYDLRPRVNRAWLAGADLQSVFNFLSSQ